MAVTKRLMLSGPLSLPHNLRSGGAFQGVPPIPIPTHDPSVAVIYMLNYYRGQHGLSPVRAAIKLMMISAAHCIDMAAHDFLSHTGSNGSSPWARMDGVGYNYGYAGEIIAEGYPGYLAVTLGWMMSPPHRDIILGPNFTEVGSGVVRAEDGTPYWTCDFGGSAN